ncbi:hypothetical protein [Asticcacaulis sp. YBE204]|uniref:hypothetical protein n=1 Tax=Asticcacaulis sp. YBE204 TaxID=1282363 RepID=UPI0003C3F517|nr:hypothetical protein [Asticcacaulis sp. YBE204]ESQ80568.1 hypothetical protein AEYBE204_04680 [Asticcacaulis sp. YBE204]
MKTALLTNANRILSVLPFAQAFTKQPQSPQLVAAAALVNAPFIRRAAPGLSAAVTIGLAAIAAVSFIKGLKRRQNQTAPDTELVRSSAT